MLFGNFSAPKNEQSGQDEESQDARKENAVQSDEGFRIVEWPERAPGISATADISVVFHYEAPGRRASITGLSPEGRRIVARLDIPAVTEPVD